MPSPNDNTGALLRSWHCGDRAALHQLLQEHLPWLRQHVGKRLGPALRARGESEDYLHDAVLDVLQYAPRFTCEGAGQFRALLARMVENNLRDADDWFAAKRRSMSQETQLPADSVLQLDTRARSVTRPSEHAQRAEERNWIRLALELLQPEDRKVILLRQWEELPFAEIGRRMGIGESGARMRFERALPKLAKLVDELRDGRIPAPGNALDP